jgi:hypothetical protein
VTAAVWLLCQPNQQQPRIRSTDIGRFPCCEEFVAGSMVPIALTINQCLLTENVTTKLEKPGSRSAQLVIADQ